MKDSLVVVHKTAREWTRRPFYVYLFRSPLKETQKYKIIRKAFAENDKNVNRKTRKISCKVELVMRGN